MIRLSILIVAAALVFSACGYTRSEAVTVRESSNGQGIRPSGQESLEPQGSAGTDSGPPPTALGASIEIPSKGAPDEIAASIEFEDGRKVEFTFAELDAVVQPSLANAQYRALGEVAETFDAQILNLMIFNKSVEAELLAAEVEVTDRDRAAAEAALLLEVSGLLAEQAADPAADRTDDAKKLFDEVPHLQLILETRSKQEAALAYFATIAEPVEVPCVSHIVVAEEETAADLLSKIDDAEDFAAAAAESSTDQASRETGGFLACVAAEEFVEPAFVAAVQAAKVGEVVGPLETSLGWHLLLVTELKAEEIDVAVLAEREFSVAIGSRVAAATITIAPAVGSWDKENATLVPASS